MTGAGGMLASPQVRVVMRFRPNNAEEKMQQEHKGQEVRQEGGGKTVPCIQYTAHSVDVTERFTLLDDGRRGPPAGDTPPAQTAPMRTPTRRFTFDAVISETATQQDVYETVGAPVVEGVLNGYNGTILAYGQTSSGKTHSMIGPCGGKRNTFFPSSPLYEARGLVPRILEALFEKLSRLDPVESTWRMKASMFEIYQDNIKDLLRRSPQEIDYRIREDTFGNGVYVESLEQVECRAAEQALQLVHGGMLRRHTAATNSNDTSSRSHLLICLYLERHDLVRGGVLISSRLNLVDLAGSEKVCKTLAVGDRLREAQCINLSLALLGNVIYRLTDGKSGYVPYRDSKLTRVLQESLGGNSLTTLLCHGSVDALNRLETLTTLRFAQRAKRVRNRPRVNRQLTAQEMRVQYTCALDQIRLLEERLHVQNDLLETQRARLMRMPDGEASEKLNTLVVSLMNEVQELKGDLHAKEASLQEQRDSAEFYRQQCAALRKELVNVRARHEKEEGTLLQMLRSAELERDTVARELEEQQANLKLCKQGGWQPLAMEGVPDSLTLQEEDLKADDSCGSTMTHHMGSLQTLMLLEPIRPPRPLTGNLRRAETINLNDTTVAKKTRPHEEQRPKTRERADKSTMTELAEQVTQAGMDGGKRKDTFDKAVGERTLPSPPVRPMQTTANDIALLEMPDMVTVQVRDALCRVADALSAANPLDPEKTLWEFEKNWVRASPKDKPPTNTVPRDVVFNTIHSAYIVFLKEANKPGEKISRGQCDDGVSSLVLTALQGLAQRRGEVAVGAMATEEVGRAVDVLKNNIAAGGVGSSRADFILFEPSGASEESVVVFEYSPSELAEARRTVKRALEDAVTVVDAELLLFLQERMHSGLTPEEVTLACRLLEAQLCAVRGASDLWSGAVQRKIDDCMGLMQTVLGATGGLRQTKNCSAAGGVNVSVSDRVGQAVRTLRSYATLKDPQDAELLAVYYHKELRQAFRVLERALAAGAEARSAATAVEGNDERYEEEEIPGVQTNLQRAIQVVRRYALALDDAPDGIKPPACLFTLSALHALVVVARLLNGVADTYGNRGPAEAGGAAILQDICATAEHVIHRASSMRLIEGVNPTLMSPLQKEETSTAPATRGGPQRDGVFASAVRKLSEEDTALTEEEQFVLTALDQITAHVKQNRTCRMSPCMLKMRDEFDGCRFNGQNNASSNEHAASLNQTPSTRPRSTEPAGASPTEAVMGIKMELPLETNDAASMTGEPSDVTPLSFVTKPTQSHEVSAQTEDSAAYAQMFENIRSMLEKIDGVGDAGKIDDVLTGIRRQLTHLQRVHEPAVLRELHDVHAALQPLQQFMQQHPCTPPEMSKRRKIPELLRHEVQRGMMSSRRGKSPLCHAPLSTRTGDSTNEALSSTTALPSSSVAAETRRIVGEALVWSRAWMALHQKAHRHDCETVARAERLEDLLDTTQRERDAHREDIDTLNEALERLRTENKMMRELLESLHVDMEACMESALQQKAINATLRTKADALKGAAVDLRCTAAQAEFCDMAETELRLKLEDLCTLETEMARMRTLHDEGLVERKRQLLQHAVRELASFARKMLGLLRAQSCFNTGTLESRRLTLLDDVAAFIDQIDGAQESLQA